MMAREVESLVSAYPGLEVCDPVLTELRAELVSEWFACRNGFLKYKKGLQLKGHNAALRVQSDDGGWTATPLHSRRLRTYPLVNEDDRVVADFMHPRFAPFFEARGSQYFILSDGALWNSTRHNSSVSIQALQEGLNPMLKRAKADLAAMELGLQASGFYYEGKNAILRISGSVAALS